MRGRTTITVALLLATPLAVLPQPAAADAIQLAAQLPFYVYDAPAVWTGSSAFIFGGVNGGNDNEIIEFRPDTGNALVRSTRLPQGRYDASAVWTGQYAFLFGGYSGNYVNQVLRYDPANDAIAVMGATLPAPRSDTAAVWDGARYAYIFGGQGSSGATNAIVRYDTLGDSVAVMSANLPTSTSGLAAVWTGSSALVFGAYRVWEYLPSSDTLQVRNQTGPVSGSAAAVWDGRYAYTFGGIGTLGTTAPLGVVRPIYRFDPSNGAVQAMATELPAARYDASAVWAGDSAYVFGGYVEDIHPPFLSVSSDILRYTLKPDAPRAVSAVAGPGAGEIRLTWQEPARNSFSDPITAYRVFRSAESGEVVVGEVQGLQFQDSGLPAGTLFRYWVAAVNVRGEGERSPSVQATTFARPGAPAALGSIPGPGEGEVTLQWLPPVAPGGAPLSYRVHRGDGAGGPYERIAELGDVLTYADRGRRFGELAYYVVSAVNVVGEGPASQESAATGTAGMTDSDVHSDPIQAEVPHAGNLTIGSAGVSQGCPGPMVLRAPSVELDGRADASAGPVQVHEPTFAGRLRCAALS